MGAYLGSSAVTAYLGTQEVSVALGAVQVLPAGTAAATLYFDGAVDSAWTTVGNWWLDDGHTQAAGRLPAAIDSVVATATVTASGQTVVNFTIGGEVSWLGGTLAVTGIATFNDRALNEGTVTGNATFNDDSSNEPIGIVAGDATFNDSSRNAGNVTGTATFTGSAFNEGTAGTFVPDPPPGL
jgi:hypothetical protein